MNHTLSYTETFLSSLPKINNNFTDNRQYSKNWTPSRPLLPSLDQLTLRINFSKSDARDINTLDYIKTIKSLLNVSCSLLKKGKVLNDWKCLLDYPNVQDNDTLTVFIKAPVSAPVSAPAVMSSNAPRIANPVAPTAVRTINMDKEEFLRELSLLIKKYKYHDKILDLVKAELDSRD